MRKLDNVGGLGHAGGEGLLPRARAGSTLPRQSVHRFPLHPRDP